MDCNDILLLDYTNYTICSTKSFFKEIGLDPEGLRKKFSKIVFPWDPCYNRDRQMFNQRMVAFPKMLIYAKNNKEVAKAIKLAQKYSFPLVIRSGGHNYEGYSINNFIVLDVERLDSIKVDKKRKLLTVGSGVTNGKIVLALSKYGLVLPTGTYPNVGIAGLVQGAGISFLNRLHGLTLDSLLEIEVILANGETVKANKDLNWDLFWSLRGGAGGNYGVVTSFTFQVYPIDKVTIFQLSFEFEKAKIFIQMWQSWAPFTNWNLTTEFNLFPDKLIFDGLYIGNEPELKLLIKNFLDLQPYEQIIKEGIYIESAKHFAGQILRPVFNKIKSDFSFILFPDEAIDIIIKNMRIGKPGDRIEFNALQGKVSTVSPDETAFFPRHALFWTQYTSYWSDHNETPSRLQWITNFYNEMKPYLSGHAYVNAADADLENYLYSYYGTNLQRLIEVKKKYDPTNFFNYPQSIPTTL